MKHLHLLVLIWERAVTDAADDKDDDDDADADSAGRHSTTTRATYRQLEYRDVYVRNSGDDAATSYRNLVSFTPVIPEITTVEVETWHVIANVSECTDVRWQHVT